MVERSLSGEEPGRSASASKESSEKTTSRAEEEEACERERGGVARMGVGGVCSIYVSRGGVRPIMVAHLHPPLETVSVSYSAHFDPILRFAVSVGDSITRLKSGCQIPSTNASKCDKSTE
jgi:hypothetical protein